jgi:uncharacterized protein YndB with AHSA1/START domain
MTADREIVITRLVDAPRGLVWDAWTRQEHLDKWWGPNGFTITTLAIDVREGGEWRFIMHGPDGTDYPNNIVFTELKQPERISHDHGGDDGKVHFQATITFEEQEGKTFITMKSVFHSKEERDYVVKEHGAIEGGKQTLGRLAEYVSKIQ